MESIIKNQSRTLLLYQPSRGGIALLNSSQDALNGSSLVWEDISSEVSAISDLQLSAPFAASNAVPNDIQMVFANKYGNWTLVDAISKRLPLDEIDQGTQIRMYNRLKHSFPVLTFIADCTQSLNSSPTEGFDILLLDWTALGRTLFWVSNNTLRTLNLYDISNDLCLDGLPSKPSSVFPFKRLAGLQVANSLLVYHQLNATAIAEDQWDDSIGGWQSSIINIETS